jgi:DDE domain
VYLYRAVDSSGATIDFLLSAKRDAAAAERFLTKALGGENHPAPRVINTDKHAGYPPAIVELKADGVLEENCRHRPVQYLNNVLEQDHRAIKRRIRASQHFRSFWAAWRTIAGYEAIHMIRKGQACRSAARAKVCLVHRHSRSVRCDELNFRSSTPTSGSTTKLQHIQSENNAYSADHEVRKLVNLAAPLRVLITVAQWDEESGIWVGRGGRTPKHSTASLGAGDTSASNNLAKGWRGRDSGWRVAS